MENWEVRQNSLFRHSLKSTASVNRLVEFHSKLISCKKTSHCVSIPTWKVFTSQIRGNPSPPRVEKPKFDYYSDVASFRSKSPRAHASPLWRNKSRTGSICSNLSGKSSPRYDRNLQVIKNEELRKAVQAINEMTYEEFAAIPQKYVLEMYEFCKIIKDRVKS